MQHRRHYRRGFALAIGAALLGLSGCMTQQCNCWNPGPIAVQQRRAIRFDPYPDQDIGPEIVGGRPLAYAQDRSEAVRSSLVREAWWGQSYFRPRPAPPVLGLPQ